MYLRGGLGGSHVRPAFVHGSVDLFGVICLSAWCVATVAGDVSQNAAEVVPKAQLKLVYNYGYQPLGVTLHEGHRIRWTMRWP